MCGGDGASRCRSGKVWVRMGANCPSKWARDGQRGLTPVGDIVDKLVNAWSKDDKRGDYAMPSWMRLKPYRLAKRTVLRSGLPHLDIIATPRCGWAAQGTWVKR